MKTLKDYIVPIAKLQSKDYIYEWGGESAFFATFEQSLVEKGTFQVKMLLRKSEALLHLNFEIKGTLELVCDRSLETFGYPFSTEGIQILRFSDHSEQFSEEMELVPRGIAEIDVSHYIYELIALAVPMKKLHPKFEEEENDDTLTLIYSSEQKDITIEKTDQLPDPRWEELRKLIDKKDK